jgi:predicted site-specific integrase-resolvase
VCVPPDVAATVAGLPAVVSLERTAAFFGVTVRTVRRWARKGRLRVSRTAPGGSGRVLIARVEIARLLVAMQEPLPFEGR